MQFLSSSSITTKLSLGILFLLSALPVSAADDGSLDALLSDLGSLLSDTTSSTDTGTNSSQSTITTSTGNTTSTRNALRTTSTSLAGTPVSRTSTNSSSGTTQQKIKTTQTLTAAKSLTTSAPVSTPEETIEMMSLFGNPVDEIETDDRSYTITRDPKNLFFRGTGYARATGPERVLRITSNKNSFYIQIPLHSDGSWTVHDTTTPGYILSRFLEKGTNTLTLSYFNIQKKVPEQGYSSQIKVIVK